MLSKSLRSLVQKFSTSTRMFIPEVKTFTQIDELNKHLEEQKNAYTAVYFRASWNPECDEADKDIARLQREYPHVKVVAVDSDQSIELKKYYDIKYEPEVVLCFYGDEVTRHVGINYDNLRDRVERVIELQEVADFGGMPKWVPFGTAAHDYYDNKLRSALRWNRQ